MDEELSKFGLHVSWAKTKVQSLGTGNEAGGMTIDVNKVDSVTEFIYLDNKHWRVKGQCLAAYGEHGGANL